jgi:hypothetical protein
LLRLEAWLQLGVIEPAGIPVEVITIAHSAGRHGGRRSRCRLPRPFGEVNREQLRESPADVPILDQAFYLIDALEDRKRINTAYMNLALLPLFAPHLQGFLINELAYDSQS